MQQLPGWNIVAADVAVIRDKQVRFARYNATMINFIFHNIIATVHLLSGGFVVIVEMAILGSFRRHGCA